jgi:divalent metal cation (Fe/Co/Zn/Cd) transporter
VFTVFIEDSAALIGLVIAGARHLPRPLVRQSLHRPGGLVVIGLLLVGAAFTLARETGALLVGESIGPDATGKLREVFDATRRSSVAMLHEHAAGPDEVLLTAAVRFKRGMRIDEVDRDAIEKVGLELLAALHAGGTDARIRQIRISISSRPGPAPLRAAMVPHCFYHFRRRWRDG